MRWAAARRVEDGRSVTEKMNCASLIYTIHEGLVLSVSDRARLGNRGALNDSHFFSATASPYHSHPLRIPADIGPAQLLPRFGICSLPQAYQAKPSSRMRGSQQRHRNIGQRVQFDFF